MTITFHQLIIDYFQLTEEQYNYFQKLGINKLNDIDFRVLKKLFLAFNMNDNDQNRILGKYYESKYLVKTRFHRLFN